MAEPGKHPSVSRQESLKAHQTPPNGSPSIQCLKSDSVYATLLLHDYRLGKQIYSGKNPVFLATCCGNDQKEESFVVKKIKFTCVSWTNELENHQALVRAIQYLKHPNILKYFGLRILDPNDQHLLGPGVAVFTEYCAAGTLFDKSRNAKGLCGSEVQRYATQIADGLAYLHGKRISHLDVKGPNIFLTNEDIVKIGDFEGSVQLRSLTHTSSDEIQRSLGTLAYMAPEMINPEQGKRGRPADIYSFGCVLIEMLTGDIPQYRHRTTRSLITDDAQLMFLIGSGGRPEIPAEAPAEIRQMIERCHHPDRASRPTARVLHEELSPSLGASLSPSQDTCQPSDLVNGLVDGESDLEHEEPATIGDVLNYGTKLCPLLEGHYVFTHQVDRLPVSKTAKAYNILVLDLVPDTEMQRDGQLAQSSCLLVDLMFNQTVPLKSTKRTTVAFLCGRDPQKLNSNSDIIIAHLPVMPDNGSRFSNCKSIRQSFTFLDAIYFHVPWTGVEHSKTALHLIQATSVDLGLDAGTNWARLCLVAKCETPPALTGDDDGIRNIVCPLWRDLTAGPLGSENVITYTAPTQGEVSINAIADLGGRMKMLFRLKKTDRITFTRQPDRY